MYLTATGPGMNKTKKVQRVKREKEKKKEKEIIKQQKK